MVSNLSIIFMFVSLAVSVLFPAGLGIFFYKKYRISLKSLLIGAAVFFVFQMILRIPLLQISSGQEWYKKLAENIWAYSLFLGISAGIFEEVGRFLGIRFVLKKELEWKNGLAFGIGHGGIEAVLIAGIGLISNIAYSFMINYGVFDTLVAGKLPANIGESLKNMLINTPPHIFAAGGIERIFAVTIQIALSLLVFYSVWNKKYIYLFAAIMLHAIIDSPVVILQRFGLGVWQIELYVLVCAAASIYFIIKSKRLFNHGSEVN